MDWSEEISAGFPQHNEAEPETLRGQIVAEISDHLNCAYQREILKSKDKATAIKSVINNFGSPSGMARKLWYEEMKGRIMMQRSVLGLMAAMSVGLIVLLVQNYQNNSNQQLMLKQNAELILAIQQNSQPALERWDPVVVKLNGEASEDESPLFYEANITTQKFSLTKKIELGSEADFGPLSFGKYTLTVKSPWGDILKREFVGGPRRDQRIEIDCPTTKYSENVIQVSIDEEFLSHLKENKLSFIVVGEYEVPPTIAVRSIGQSQWRIDHKSHQFVEFVLGTPRHNDELDRTKMQLPVGANFNVMYSGVLDKSAKYQPGFLDEILGRKSFGKGEIESEYFQTVEGRTLKYKAGYSDHGMPKGFPFQLSYYAPPISKLSVGKTLSVTSDEAPVNLPIDYPKRFRTTIEKYLAKKKEPAYEDYFIKIDTSAVRDTKGGYRGLESN